MGKLITSSLGLSAVGIASFFFGRSTPAPVETAQNENKTTFGGVGKPAGGELITPSPVQPDGFYKYGFPGPVHDLAKHAEFVTCYDRAKRNPYWVLEHITKESIKRSDGVDRKKSIFKEDETVPVKFRARLRDFFRSGYDRGHNAPAADAKFTQQAMDETFLLTNMSPQVGDGFNRDYWAHFEDFARRLTTKYDGVRIMTGPLYLPKLCDDGKYRVQYEVIGLPPNVAVPTHFFKLIVGERNGDANIAVGAFVLPNVPIDNTQPLTAFQVPVEALERSAGLELLHKVPYYNKKDLCKETKCEIIVREFPKQVSGLLPPGK
ncbi:endonuclease G [Metschnikowia aff. pulcherrima]|uniref:Endonuclease G n=1 Tax=Metschnikowia aff. pulcherrima TaxID=2163413 RepID=A0A4P6XTH1_9ASCO|nr:endonuclease G [Metschnikowia aff. pulcherrima]